MDAVKTLLQWHLSSQRARFAHAVDAVERLLNYTNVEGQPVPAIRALTERLLGAEDGVLHNLLLGPTSAGAVVPPGVHLYDVPYAASVERMEWVSRFVGYELIDDGEPGIAWWRYDFDSRPFACVRCNEGDKGAQAFVVRSVDALRAAGWEARSATAENVLAALRATTARSVRFKVDAARLEREREPTWCGSWGLTPELITTRRFARTARKAAKPSTEDTE